MFVKNNLIAILLASIVTSAHAGFVNEAADNPFEASTQIKIFGVSGQAGFDTVRGMGREQPLSEALAQIVPKGYSIRAIGIEAYAGTPINWKGGKEWTEVLRDAVRSVPEVLVEIDVASRAVTLRSRADVKISPVQSASVTAAWEVRADDKTFKAMITRWAKIAGWQLYWEIGVDYPILASATISGRFEEAVGDVVRAMQSADVPPKAVFYENKVLRITSRGVE